MESRHELQTWLEDLCNEVCVRPQSPGLFDYFRGRGRAEDLTPTLLNQMNNLLCRAYSQSSAQKSQCVQYLYYWVLDFIMEKLHPIQVSRDCRFKTVNIQDLQAAQEKLRCPDFHHGLIAMAMDVVAAVMRKEDASPSTILQTAEESGLKHNMLSVWDASRMFLDCLEDGRPHAIPNILRSLITATKTRAEEELVFAEGSLVYEVIFSGGGGMYSEGDMTLVGSFISSVADLATSRAISTAQRLAAQAGLKAQGSGGSQDYMGIMAARVVDHVMLEHLDLCFGNHLSVIVACSVFSVFKAARVPLQFKALLQEMAAEADRRAAPLLQQLSVKAERDMEQTFKTVSQAAGQQAGDIRTWYNAVYLPRLESFIRCCVASPVIDQAAATDANTDPAASIGSGIPDPDPEFSFNVLPSQRAPSPVLLPGPTEAPCVHSGAARDEGMVTAPARRPPLAALKQQHSGGQGSGGNAKEPLKASASRSAKPRLQGNRSAARGKLKGLPPPSLDQENLQPGVAGIWPPSPAAGKRQALISLLPPGHGGSNTPRKSVLMPGPVESPSSAFKHYR